MPAEPYRGTSRRGDPHRYGENRNKTVILPWELPVKPFGIQELDERSFHYLAASPNEFALRLMRSLFTRVRGEPLEISDILLDKQFFNLHDEDRRVLRFDELPKQVDERYYFASLVMVAAALQGGKEFAREKVAQAKSSGRNIAPIAYSNILSSNLSSSIREAGVAIGLEEWDGNKITFYNLLGSIIHQTSQGRFDLYSTFAYCQSARDGQHIRGTDIFNAYFPHFAHKVLNAEVDLQLLRTFHGGEIPEEFWHKYKMTAGNKIRLSALVDDLILFLNSPQNRHGMLKPTFTGLISLLEKISNNMGVDTILDPDLAIELHILQQGRINAERIHNIKRATQSRLLTMGDSREVVEITSPNIIRKSPDRWRDPREFGLDGVDPRVTTMLREFFGEDDAFVLPMTELRRGMTSQVAFANLQRSILETAAKVLHLDLVNGPPLSEISQIHADSTRTESYRTHFQRHIKRLQEIDPTLVVLMYSKGQEFFQRNLPINVVMPHVLLGNKAVPITDVGHRPAILKLLHDDPNAVVNQLPFFHHFNPADLTTELTIPGSYFREALKHKCLIRLVHGVARYLICEGNNFPTTFSDHYMPWRKPEKGQLDIDVFGADGEKTLAQVAWSVAQNINQRYGLKRGMGEYISASTMQGRSMSGTEYVSMWNQLPTNIKPSDLYEIAHSPATILQVFHMWLGGGLPGVRTNLVVEMLLSLEKLRSMSFEPVWLDNKRGDSGFVLRFSDPLGGLSCFMEGGGGVVVREPTGESYHGRTAINYASYPDAFPVNRAMSWYMVLRTLNDIFYTKNGGVFLPEGAVAITNRSYFKNWDDIKTGNKEMRTIIQRLQKNRESMLEGLNQVQRADLRKEMEKIKDLYEANLLDLMTLFSGSDSYYEDTERGLGGILLSTLYPFVDVLRARPHIWKKLYEKVKSGAEKGADETNLHFLARVIWSDNEALALLIEELRTQFEERPFEIGKKLSPLSLDIFTRSKLQKRMGVSEANQYEALDWASIDMEWLAPLVMSIREWDVILTEIREKTEKGIPYFNEEDTLVKLIAKQNKDGVIDRRRQTIENRDTEEVAERQIQTIMSILVYPGFG